MAAEGSEFWASIGLLALAAAAANSRQDCRSRLMMFIFGVGRNHHRLPHVCCDKLVWPRRPTTRDYQTIRLRAPGRLRNVSGSLRCPRTAFGWHMAPPRPPPRGGDVSLRRPRPVPAGRSGTGVSWPLPKPSGSTTQSPLPSGHGRTGTSQRNVPTSTNGMTPSLKVLGPWSLPCPSVQVRDHIRRVFVGRKDRIPDVLDDARVAENRHAPEQTRGCRCKCG